MRGAPLPELPPVIAIVGPTAVGKSRLAMELAADLRADIVSADSRQVYRYMDIGTAKPSPRERALVPHHLIDLVEPDESYSVRRYRDEGRRVLQRVSARGRLALVVGGTGFYLRTLLDGLSLPDVPPDPQFRALMREEAARSGPAALHERLRRLDPASAERIHAHNLPRIIRALEVIEHAGGRVPEPVQAERISALYLGLTMERRRLREVANTRVLSQVGAGLVEETRLLLEMGYSPEAHALQGFGYRQMASYLQGRSSLEAAVAEYQTATQQYIRRQMTWFRADTRIRWFDAQGDAPAEARRMIDEWLA